MELQYFKKSSPEYPQILNYYERMPDGLYLKGKFPDPSRKTVAIVGARNCSSYGRGQALQFARILAQEGVQIISGLAFGIDTYAHQGALQGGGKTFAVMGCGADVCYPKENYLLYEEILKNEGGILSEYEPGTPPLAWHFPIRNRIISALADIVLVIEARKKSGSLITAEYALEQGKSIYAVPGRIGDSCSSGCNALIAQGAGIAWGPEALLEELFPEWMDKEQGEEREKSEKKSFAEGRRENSEKIQKLTGEERLVFNQLDSQEKSLAEISASCGLESRKVAAILTMFCMDGQAVSLTPGYYCRAENW